MELVKNIVVTTVGTFCIILAGMVIADYKTSGFSKFQMKAVVLALVVLGLFLIHTTR